MTPFLKYSLDLSDYTFRNAILFGNCQKHWELGYLKNSSGSFPEACVHYTIAIVEAIPVLGQIASLFEKLIIECYVNQLRTKFDQKRVYTKKDFAENPIYLKFLVERNLLSSEKLGELFELKSSNQLDQDLVRKISFGDHSLFFQIFDRLPDHQKLIVLIETILGRVGIRHEKTDFFLREKLDQGRFFWTIFEKLPADIQDSVMERFFSDEKHLYDFIYYGSGNEYSCEWFLDNKTVLNYINKNTRFFLEQLATSPFLAHLSFSLWLNKMSEHSELKNNKIVQTINNLLINKEEDKISDLRFDEFFLVFKILNRFVMWSPYIRDYSINQEHLHCFVRNWFLLKANDQRESEDRLKKINFSTLNIDLVDWIIKVSPQIQFPEEINDQWIEIKSGYLSSCRLSIEFKGQFGKLIEKIKDKRSTLESSESSEQSIGACISELRKVNPEINRENAKSIALKILELQEKASLEEIHPTYYRLCKRYHPDKGGDLQKFQQIANAYQLISLLSSSS